uniref:VWFA domain-containing protein n=1 Tax=Panagrolaimus sp. JU765 TaxID=591449 RepID=A0AC34QNG2_9BILA
MYTLSINDVSTCMVQVRITGGVQIFPGYISVPSSAPQVGSHLDNTTAIPTAGTNVLALHVNSDVVGVQYARLWPTYSAMGEIQYVQLYPRYGCSYEWYSDPFVCDEAGYFITVFGFGSRGAPFARHFYTRCNGYNGTTVAPPTGPTTPIPTGPPVTTVPGQTTTPSKYYPVTADVVFLIDNSQSFTQAQFTDTANFILNALQPFNIGATNNLHVALLTILGDYDQFAYTVANLNGIYDYNGLRNALNNAFQPDGPTSGTGNSALEQALKLVMGPDFKNAGYRPSINNHLIVYITAITSPNPPSIAQAQVILNSGDYKIVAISYQGNGGNTAALTSLTGNVGCVLQSSTQADYTGAFAQSFTDKIFNAY